MERFKLNKKGFTLAETLITLGIIGVVAAITIPTWHANVQERVRREQLRTIKFKFTQATDSMKTQGLLPETTSDATATNTFVTELSKHLKLAKICDNSHLNECWPTETINMSDGTTKRAKDLKTGESISALALGSKSTTTMGIITADGTPMILVYSPKCTPLEQEKTYTWSTVDNKPETNATTNCVSAIMDINGHKRPNKIGQDVRTLNSLFGYVKAYATYGTLSESDCKRLKNKLGINWCPAPGTPGGDPDYWGGAVKYCHDLGLHLPSEQTLATLAGSIYGRSDITPKTVISSINYAKTHWGDQGDKTCEQIWRSKGWGDADQVICIDSGTNNNMGQYDSTSAISTLRGYIYWSSVESETVVARTRYINSYYSDYRTNHLRFNSTNTALCVGD